MTGAVARRLVLLLAADPADPATAEHAQSELEHLRSRLGSQLTNGFVRTAPAENPLADQGGIMATTPVGAVLDVGLSDGLEDEALLDALDGFRQRHRGVFDPATSAALAGPVHRMRARPLDDAQADTAIRVIVAVRPPPAMSLEQFRAGWARAGDVNRRNHPVCLAYAQLHADPDLSRRASDALGISSKTFAGLAIEVFASQADLHVGHHWATSPESVEGAPEPAAHLMELLGRYLDLAAALTFIAVENPSSYP